MKRWAAVRLLVLMALVPPSGVVLAAQGTPPESGDWVVVGESAVVGDGQTVDGDVVVIGGSLRLADGGRVSGDVVSVGGSVELAGRVDGDVVMVGASLQVVDGAQIGGETVVVGGESEVAEETALAGGFVAMPGPDLAAVNLPGLGRGLLAFRFDPTRWIAAPLSKFIGGLVGALGGALISSALAALVLYLWPGPLRRIGRAVTRTPAAAGGVGCLSLALFPLLAAMSAATLVLIPLAVALTLAFLAALLAGWVTVGVLFGERLWEWLGTSGTAPAAAGIVGTFGLTLLVGAAGALPGLGPAGLLSGLVLATIGVGAVVLTRFGRRAYQPVPAAGGDGPGAGE